MIMDQRLIDEVKEGITKLDSHARGFMKDPPSRSWSGFGGRCNTACKFQKDKA